MSPVENDYTHIRETESSLPFFGQPWKETPFCFHERWRKRGQPNTSDASRGRGERPAWRNSLGAVEPHRHQPGLVRCLRMAVPPFAPPGHPAFGSACSNHADSFVMSVSLWIGCGMSKARGFFESRRNPFSSSKSLVEFDGWTTLPLLFFVCVCVLSHGALQPLVYTRVVEFVHTLINSLLKCF